MTTYFCHSGVTGNAAYPTISGHRLSGRAKLCGPDTATSDPVTPNDINAGTDPALPWQSLAQALLAGGNDNTLYLAGRHYVDLGYVAGDVAALDFTELFRFTVAQWSGMDPFVLYACVKVASVWADAGGGAWTTNIGAGLLLAGVYHDWDLATKINSAGNGERKSSYKFTGAAATAAATTTAVAADYSDDAATAKTAVLAAVTATRGAWDYNGTTGLLTVATPGGGTPATKSANGLAYVVKDLLGIAFHSSTGANASNQDNTVSGLGFAMFTDSGSPSPGGTCVFSAGADRCTVQNCWMDDHGLHAISWGSGCTNNTTNSNTINGEGNAIAGNSIVFNAGGTTGGNANHVTGCKSIRDIVYSHSLLDDGGLPWNRGNAVGGFYAHGGGGSEVRDVEFVNCQVIEFVPASGSADVVVKYYGANCSTPSDVTNPETFPFRIRQTDPTIKTIKNGTFLPDQGVTLNWAFIGCRLDMSGQARLSNGFGVELVSVTGTTLHVGCEIVANLTNGNGSEPCAPFRIGANQTLRFLNCSIYDAASAHSAHKYSVVEWFDAAATLYMSGCIVGYRDVTTGTFQVLSTDPATAARVNVSDNLYWNVGATTYADQASRNTLAELDPNGVALAANPNSDTTGASLEPTGAVKALKKTLASHATYGFNGRAYGGLYGGWQPGSGGGRVKRLGGGRAFRLNRV